MANGTDRVALVTGGGRGIGAATARRLSADGLAVAVMARTAGDVDAVAQAISADGGRALAVTGDIADAASAARAVAQVVAAFGRLDVLVNNAGSVAPIGHLGDTDPAAWAQCIQVNLLGAFHMAHAALPHLLAAPQQALMGGTVVNVSSGAAHRALEGWSAYCCAKAGEAMLTQALHHEYGDRGLRVFGFGPGVVDTDMQVQIRASGMNPVSQLPRADLAPADAPAQAIAWLCTAAADDWAGRELSIKDEDLRARVGL
ncbi:MAG: SDR family oxidoreductase [Rhodobacterales bacterium]|nr:SDR family oxidoreductase [Rhodobacterales bacterium]